MEPGLFSLIILCPKKDFFEGEVREVVFSTPVGRIGVMAGHAPMVAAVAECLLEIMTTEGTRIAALGQGFAEIANNKAEFFVDTAEWAEEIDAARAKEALELAQQRLHSNITRIEHLQAQATMSRALARLKAVESSSIRQGKA